MVRISKQSERRQKSPRKNKNPSVKTGPRKDVQSSGFNLHENAIPGETAQLAYIPKIK